MLLWIRSTSTRIGLEVDEGSRRASAAYVGWRFLLCERLVPIVSVMHSASGYGELMLEYHHPTVRSTYNRPGCRRSRPTSLESLRINGEACFLFVRLVLTGYTARGWTPSGQWRTSQRANWRAVPDSAGLEPLEPFQRRIQSVYNPSTKTSALGQVQTASLGLALALALALASPCPT